MLNGFLLLVNGEARFTNSEIAGILEALEEGEWFFTFSSLRPSHTIAASFKEKPLADPKFRDRGCLYQIVFMKVSGDVPMCHRIIMDNSSGPASSDDDNFFEFRAWLGCIFALENLNLGVLSSLKIGAVVDLVFFELVEESP